MEATKIYNVMNNIQRNESNTSYTTKGVNQQINKC